MRDSREQLREDYAASMVVSLAIWVINAATLDTANKRGTALFAIFSNACQPQFSISVRSIDCRPDSACRRSARS